MPTDRPKPLDLPPPRARPAPPAPMRPAQGFGNIPNFRGAPHALDLPPPRARPALVTIPIAPPRGNHVGPPAPAIGENPNLQKLLGAAHDADPVATADPRFRNRLDRCLSAKTPEIMSWGEAEAAVLRQAADTQAQIARKVATIDGARIADECRVAATKPPGLFERKGDKAQFYERTMTSARTMLGDVLSEIASAVNTLRPKIDSLRVDILALQIAQKVMDPMQQTIADGRLRTLVSGQQMSVMALQTFDNQTASILKLIQDMDQLLTVVIPGWKLANA